MLADDDYPADEVARGETRRRLEALLHTEGRRVRLTTRSPRVLRDLDLLRRLDGHHAVSVGVALPSVNASIAHRLEGPTAAPPARRLRAVSELSAAGLAVTLVWTPMLAGVNDDPQSVDRLFAAARRAGAWDVEMRLPRVSMFGRWRLSESVRKLFDLRGRLRPEEARRLRDLFTVQRLAQGFPRTLPGRG